MNRTIETGCAIEVQSLVHVDCRECNRLLRDPNHNSNQFQMMFAIRSLKQLLVDCPSEFRNSSLQQEKRRKLNMIIEISDVIDCFDIEIV